MAEPPQKRSRRPDSKQMWDEADKRNNNSAPVPTRERDEPRRDDRDRNRDRERRYRSRSPRDGRADRGGRDRERDYRSGNGRGERDRDGHRDRERDSRGSARGRDVTERVDRGEFHALMPFREKRGSRKQQTNEHFGDVDARGGRRDRSRSRDREQRRSRSPRREPNRDSTRREEESGKAASNARSAKLDDDRSFDKSRTSTPPVSFKVGVQSQNHDSEGMDINSKSQPSKKSSRSRKHQAPESEEDDDDELVVEDDGMAAMQAMMGFGGFGTTHQKKVAGNNVSAVRKEKKTEYRQYMNRVGGFNRPLSPTREG